MFRHFSIETEEGPWQVRVHGGPRRCGKQRWGGGESNNQAEHGGGPFGMRGFRGGPRGWGRGSGFGDMRERMRERMFDSGELQLVILHLLAEEPSYGYQLIKRLETKLAGGYTPSAGVIYPTLSLLEESGFTEASNSPEGKKVYSVTAEGKAHLEANKERLAEVLARLEHAGHGFRKGRSPELMGAFMNLRGAVKTRVSRGNLREDQLKKITDAINAAAKVIDEL